MAGLALASLLTAGCAATQAPQAQPEGSAATRPAQKTLAQRAVDHVEDVTGPLTSRDADDEPKDDVQRTSVPIAGSNLVHGRSTVTVKAPIERVREVVLAFDHYAEFMPHYRASKLLGRTRSGARDVYMEIEALNGAITMAAHIEVGKPTFVDGFETYVTAFVEGKSVKDFQAIWRMRKIDDEKTELSLEVFLDPIITLPASLQNEENVKGSASGVLAMRARAEAR